TERTTRRQKLKERIRRSSSGSRSLGLGAISAGCEDRCASAKLVANHQVVMERVDLRGRQLACERRQVSRRSRRLRELRLDRRELLRLLGDAGVRAFSLSLATEEPLAHSIAVARDLRRLESDRGVVLERLELIVGEPPRERGQRSRGSRLGGNLGVDDRQAIRLESRRRPSLIGDVSLSLEELLAERELFRIEVLEPVRHRRIVNERRELVRGKLAREPVELRLASRLLGKLREDLLEHRLLPGARIDPSKEEVLPEVVANRIDDAPARRATSIASGSRDRLRDDES